MNPFINTLDQALRTVFAPHHASRPNPAAGVATVQMTDAERQTAMERISIRNSIENLRTFPYIRALEEAGDIAIHGAWFDISNGELWVMDSETRDFKRLDPEIEVD